MKKGIILMIAIGVFFLICAIICISGFLFAGNVDIEEVETMNEDLETILNDKDSTKEAETENKIEYKPVEAKDLINIYENEKKGDKEYKDKYVMVKGVVNSIDTILDQDVLTLGSGEDFEIIAISCYFSKEEAEKLIDINIGDEVIIKGKVKGKSLNIELKGCVYDE